MAEDIGKGTLEDYLKLLGDDADNIIPFMEYRNLRYHVAEHAMSKGDNYSASNFFVFTNDFLNKGNDSLVKPTIRFYEKAKGWYGLAYVLFREVLNLLPDTEGHPANEGIECAEESYNCIVKKLSTLEMTQKIYEDKEKLDNSQLVKSV
jgi:hypothetical protein